MGVDAIVCRVGDPSALEYISLTGQQRKLIKRDQGVNRELRELRVLPGFVTLAG